MFKTPAIILSIQRIRDTKFRVILFTREYWRVTCWFNKKDLSKDIGDAVMVHIERIWRENIIKHIDVITRVDFGIWNYETIMLFLEIIRMFSVLLPDSVPHVGVFDDYTRLLKVLREWTVLESFHYSLLQFRILRILWFVDDSSFREDARMSYIHARVASVPVHKIFESKPLSANEGSLLRKITHETLYSLA